MNNDYLQAIHKKSFSKAQYTILDGYHFFVTHKDRADRIGQKIKSDNFDIGNIIGYIYPSPEQGARFIDVSVLTDKNYLIMYADNLIDDNKQRLNSGWKITDIFVMSVCQIVNKMSRIDQYENMSYNGKFSRQQIQLAIE